MSSDKFPFAPVAPFSPYRANYSPQSASLIDAQESLRSEERRVGKECAI